jgi:hypothetical protein
MSTRGATLAALLVVVGKPAWWLLALAGFLARGGIILFLVAVVTLPSPLALSNVVAPLLLPFVFGGVTPVIVVLVVSVVVSLVAWVVVGGWIGAATEVVLIRDARRAAVEEGLEVREERATSRWVVARVTVAHLLAHVPLLVATAFGSFAIVNVAYVELVNPFEVVTPLPLRIVGGAIGPIIVIVFAWLFGEIIGGLAARRIVLDGASVVRAIGGAYVELILRPVSSILPAALTCLVFAAELVGMLAAVMLAWTAARARIMAVPIDTLPAALATASFAAAWGVAMAVAGLIDGWRSVAMTFEAERSATDGEQLIVGGGDGIGAPAPLTPVVVGVGVAESAGTFGVPPNGRPGDWSAGSGGGSL